jgi:hypothetical protein
LTTEPCGCIIVGRRKERTMDESDIRNSHPMGVFADYEGCDTDKPGATAPKTYDFPVYATQGGGLARRSGDTYIFEESPPPEMGLGVGDVVPREWDLIPANSAAEEEVLSYQFGDE